jgi:regulator of PEP synthase PpsR (kinase-PPPase family)
LVYIRTFRGVERDDQLVAVFRVAARQGAFVVSTLVSDSARARALVLAAEHEVQYVDLIGPLLGEFRVFLEAEPVQVPGLLHQTDDSYFRRIEAVEFTVKADDGKEPRMLRQADIILVGVSRTSKTPLSTYLAHKGFKVGNVPIVLDRSLPTPLYEVDPQRVFALTIDPEALQSIRRSRLRAMGMARMNYDDMDYILAELEFAEQLYRSHRDWPVIDVTNKAVEETAAVILGILDDRGLTRPTGDPSQL